MFNTAPYTVYPESFQDSRRNTEISAGNAMEDDI